MFDETGMAKDRRRSRFRHWMRISLLVLGPLVVLLGAGYFYVTGGRYVSTDDAFVKADKTTISTDVAGRVVQVNVVENQVVKVDQPLFKLDDEPYRLALARAEANVNNVRNNIEALLAGYAEKQVALKQAQDTVDYATRDFQRNLDLRKQGVVAQSKFDDAQHALDMAHRQVAIIQQQLASILAQLGGDPTLAVERYPQLKQAEAERDQAALDLRHCIIYAPGNGIVSNVTVQPGDYLKVGNPVFSLVLSDQPYVEANFKETELTHVRVGQKATLSVDTYPDRTWNVRVTSISPATGSEFSLLPPQNASGNWVKVVQRIPVRFSILRRPGDPPLRAGMSVTVEVDTGYQRPMPHVVSAVVNWLQGSNEAAAAPANEAANAAGPKAGRQ
ncbi:MAG TPA: HlyD family secretion protein [Candidatus Sulfotelmatobacter sp.]|nr:HlyD family secretion protein [Candidatus Sulfotelmatobacter sp.]